jgi:hypothetical protein
MSKLLTSGLALLLFSSAYAQAAAPILSGSYVLVLRQWCEGNVTAHFNGSNLVDTLDYDGGATFTLFGSAKFDPDKGKVKLSGFSHNGSPFLLTRTGNQNTTDGIPLVETPLSASGKYKTTADTFKLGEETFHAIYSQIDGNGVAHAATFMGLIPGLITCSAQGEATRQ